ncbi:MAG: insulinase family protein, partial [Novosphingobium sp.]
QRTFFAGQPLADRSPIGTVATLQGATAESVRAFHQRWYRPERMVVIVAGDADPATLSGLVRQHFGSWKVPGKPTPSPSFGDPVAPKATNANPVGEAQVIVEPDFPRTVTYSILRPWRQVNDTIVYNQGLMTDALAQAIINQRLEARARTGGSYLVAQVGQQDISRSADVTQVSVTPLADDWRVALRDVRAVIADALAQPPSQDEIDRAVAEMEVAYQVPVEQRPLLRGAKLADDLVQAVDIRETVASPEDVLAIFRKSVPLFTPARVLDHTRKLFDGVVTRAVYVTPSAGEASAEALQLAMREAVTPDATARLDTAPVSFADMPAIGEPGPIAAIRPTGLVGIEQVDFGNGVKAMIYPTSDEPGRVAVKVRFGGGYRSFHAKDAPYVALGEMALVGSGVATLGEAELERISTGRKLGFQFEIDDAAFQFAADTREADLADQLYLFAAKFALPRWDANPVLRAKAAARIQYDAFGASPQGVIQRDLKFLQRDRDPLFRMPTPAEIEAITPEGFRSVWQPALATGPIEVQIYGDFNRTNAIAALQRTFGALPVRPPLPAGTAPATARFPAPGAEPVVLTHRGDADQAAALVSWKTGGGMAGIRESRQLEILTQVFSNRLLQAMREKSGASYAPQVYSTWPVDLDSGGTINAIAQIEPGSVPTFLATAKEIAADLIARPPSLDELARVTEPLRQQITRAATGSAFFMYQLEGATADPSRIAAIRTLLPDYSQTTPAAMQALAARYLAPDKAWELVVMPEGKARTIAQAH